MIFLCPVKEWAEKHHWAVAEEKAEEKNFGRKKSGNQKVVGRFETDENGHYKWAGPRPEKERSIYDVLSAVFVGKARKLATADTG